MSRLSEIVRLKQWQFMVAAFLIINGNSLFAIDTHTPGRLPNDVDGFIEPYRTTNVSAAEQGIVTEMLVKEGDTVHQGQLLATLDVDVLEATKEVAKANKDSLGRINSAVAALALKNERYDKLKELQAEGHAHPEEVLRAETEVKIAEAELLAAKEDQNIKGLEYSRIETQIERRKIVSPIDGFVAKVHKEVSEYVAATDPAVITIVQCNRLKVVFPVPAKDASHFSVGQKVTVHLSEGGESCEGQIEAVSPVTDPESGTVRVKVVLKNSEGHYRSGMACSLTIPPLPQQASLVDTYKNTEK